jgi:UDP-N-acetylmuramyl pentapeptide phosphotransferase/UDP-N-acetylglucosamine-1-phosphate transferase
VSFPVEITLAAFVFSALVQFLFIRLLQRYGIFGDSPYKPQGIHRHVTPRAGGVGVFSGLLFLLAGPVDTMLAIAFSLALLSGIIEDFNGSLSPKIRLILQLIAALWGVFVTHAVVTYLGLGIDLPYMAGVLFSAFAIVGLMNAMNIIDGLNGLAGGISVLILLSYGYVAYRTGDETVMLMSVIGIASIAGFLLFNFPKGLIFLGDGGAYLIGFYLALSGIYLAANHDEVSPWYIMATLIYPVWEVIFSVFRRLRKHHSPLYADNTHLHTLLYKKIGNNPLSAFLIVLSYIPFLAVATLFANHSAGNLGIVIIFIIFYILLYQRLMR